jgi:hypothetical protein
MVVALNTLGRFELFLSPGTVVVFRFDLLDSGSLCRGISENVFHFFTLACIKRQIHSEYFFFTFIRKGT